MSSKFENIFRINRKSLFATLSGFKTSGAFFLVLEFQAKCINLVGKYKKPIS